MAKYDSRRHRHAPLGPATSRFPVVQSQLLDVGPALSEECEPAFSTESASVFPLPPAEDELMEALPLPEAEESTRVRALAQRPPAPLSSPAAPASPAIHHASEPRAATSAVRQSAEPRAALPVMRQSSEPRAPATGFAADLEQEVRTLVANGRSREALDYVEQSCRSHPEAAELHLLALKVAVKLAATDSAVLHAEWLIGHWFRSRRVHEACEVYRRVVEHASSLPWTERGLVALLLAADGADDPRLVAEATRLMMSAYPHSQHLSGALLKTAAHQLKAGREELAFATFRHVANAYPGTPQAQHAQHALAGLMRSPRINQR